MTRCTPPNKLISLFSDNRIQIYCNEQGEIQAEDKKGKEITISGLPSRISKENINQARKSLRNASIIATPDASFRLNIRLRGGMLDDSDDFNDPVTFEIMRTPTRIKTCGHVFDATTLSSINECPFDRGTFTQADLETDTSLQARIHRRFPANPIDIVVIPPKIVNPNFVGNSKKSVLLYKLIKQEIDDEEFQDAQQRFRELSQHTSTAEHFALQPLIYEGLFNTSDDQQEREKHKTCAMYSHFYLGRLYSIEEQKELALASFRMARELAQELHLARKRQEFTEDYIEALRQSSQYQEMVEACIELAMSYKLQNQQKANEYFTLADEVCKEQEAALTNPSQLRLTISILATGYFAAEHNFGQGIKKFKTYQQFFLVQL